MRIPICVPPMRLEPSTKAAHRRTLATFEAGALNVGYSETLITQRVWSARFAAMPIMNLAVLRFDRHTWLMQIAFLSSRFGDARLNSIKFRDTVHLLGDVWIAEKQRKELDSESDPELVLDSCLDAIQRCPLFICVLVDGYGEEKKIFA